MFEYARIEHCRPLLPNVQAVCRVSQLTSVGHCWHIAFIAQYITKIDTTAERPTAIHTDDGVMSCKRRTPTFCLLATAKEIYNTCAAQSTLTRSVEEITIKFKVYLYMHARTRIYFVADAHVDAHLTTSWAEKKTWQHTMKWKNWMKWKWRWARVCECVCYT